MIIGRRVPRAFPAFLRVWREHVAKGAGVS